jgi:ribonucleoside-triphosphate reductase
MQYQSHLPAIGRTVFLKGIYFDKDTDPSPAVPPAEAKKTDTPAEPMIPKTRFDEVNNKLKEIQSQLDAKTKAEQEAEEARLKEKEDFKTLAEQHKARVADLEPKVEALDKETRRYKEALEAQLKTAKSQVPEHLHSLLEKLDPVEQLKWIADNADKIKEQSNKLSGIPRTPKPVGDNGKQADELQAKQRRLVRSNF